MSSAEPANSRRPWISTWSACLVLSVLFTGIVVQWSMRLGRLSMETMYDDVVYLLDGLERVRLLDDERLGTLLKDLARDPPHSAWSTGVAMVSFLVFGAHDWAPYVLNGILVLVLLRFVQRRTASWPPWWQWLILLGTLTFPLAFSLVHEFRPDHACGLFSAVACYMAAEATLETEDDRRRRRQLIASSAVFGLVLLIKPTFFAHTLALMAGCVTFASFAAFRRAESGRLAEAFRDSLRLILPAILIALPYYALSNFDGIRYFFRQGFVDTWLIKGGVREVLFYYTLGGSGEKFLGQGGMVWVVIATVVILLGLRFGKRRYFWFHLWLGTLAVGSFIVMIVGRTGNPFFGTTLHLLVWFAVIRAIGALRDDAGGAVPPRLARAGRIAGGAWLAFILATNLVMFRPLVQWAINRPVRRDVGNRAGGAVSMGAGIVDAVIDDLTELGMISGRQTTVYVGVEGSVNRDNLTWLALKRGVPLRFVSDYFGSDLEHHRRLINQAHYVITADEHADNLSRYLPFWVMRDEIEQIIEDDPALEPLATFRTASGGSYRVFADRETMTVMKISEEHDLRADFGMFAASEGFLPLEGPLPDMPFTFRWGLYPEAEFTFDAPAPGPARLIIETKATEPQVIVVEHNGRPVGRGELAGWAHFQEIVIPLELRQGPNGFLLRFENKPPSADDGRRRAAPFRRLAVEVETETDTDTETGTDGGDEAGD